LRKPNVANRPARSEDLIAALDGAWVVVVLTIPRRLTKHFLFILYSRHVGSSGKRTRGRPIVRTVLITGTSSGMGRELALQFAERGWNVAATMRDLADPDPAFADREQVLVMPLDDVGDRRGGRRGRIPVRPDRRAGAAGYAQTGTLEENSPRINCAVRDERVRAVSVTKAVLPQMACGEATSS
jgi:hypothetical protein